MKNETIRTLIQDGDGCTLVELAWRSLGGVLSIVVTSRRGIESERTISPDTARALAALLVVAADREDRIEKRTQSEIGGDRG